MVKQVQLFLKLVCTHLYLQSFCIHTKQCNAYTHLICTIMYDVCDFMTRIMPARNTTLKIIVYY